MVEMEFRTEQLLPKNRDGRFIAAFLMAAMGHTEDEIKEALFPELVKHWPANPGNPANSAACSPQRMHM